MGTGLNEADGDVHRLHLWAAGSRALATEVKGKVGDPSRNCSLRRADKLDWTGKHAHSTSPRGSQVGESQNRDHQSTAQF